MKNNTLKNLLSVSVVLLVFALLLSFATALLQPKYMTDLEEGSFISQYYREAGGHDVIFIGDCEVYANFSPMEMYRHRGITSYVRGTSQQLIWQSYHVLEETLTYETPWAVVYNVNAMRYSEPVSEAYNRLTADRMRWSASKVGLITSGMMEEEDFLSYVFPILRYHSRFDKLTAEDLQYLLRVKDNTWNGYQMNTGIVPMESLPTKRPLPDYQFGDICYEYLDKMRKLCESKGVELILIKAPSQYPYWYAEYDQQIRDYAQEHDLEFYNFTEAVEEIGLDFWVDTYDAGLHLNLTGATKMSRYFADILAENHDIPDHRNDGETAAEYNAKLGLYDAEVAAAVANMPDVPPRPQEAVKPSVPAEETVPVDTEPVAAPEMPVQSDKTDVVVADGTFAYTYRGTPLVPGEVFDAGKLPKPMATTTIPSCAFSGTDNVYTYDSIEVVAYDEGQGEHLYSIYLLDPNTPTDEGLMLGDSVERMVELYGEDYTQTGSEYAYYRGDTILIVLAPGNTINSIEIRMAG